MVWRRFCSYLLVSWSFLGVAQAGMDSGGVPILLDTHNPWFVNNTDTVHYCIKRDETHFPIADTQLDGLIHKAVGYWRDQLAQAVLNPIPQKVSPTTPMIHWKFLPEGWIRDSTCKDTTDIAFQFGVLEENQRDYLPEPKAYLGALVRTAYDRKQLKARGFVYIAPESGPLQFQSPMLHPTPWQLANHDLLYAVLTHELGHMLGIPDEAADLFNIMGQRYYEWMLGKEQAAFTAKLIAEAGLPDFTRFQGSRWGGRYMSPCPRGETARSFFEIDASEYSNCQLSLESDTVLRLDYAIDGSPRTSAMGSAELQRYPAGDVTKAMVLLYLPAEQEVFDIDREIFIDTQLVAFRYEQIAYQGIYGAAGSDRTKPVLVRFDPFGAMSIDGVVDDAIVPNLWKALR